MNSTLKMAIGAALLATVGATLAIRGTDPPEVVPPPATSSIVGRVEEAAIGSRSAPVPALLSMSETTAREALATDPPEEPGNDEPAVPTPPDLHLSRLDRLAATFLTGNPDLVGFNEFVRSLAADARVLPETVTTVDDEPVKGEVAFEGTGLRASFEIEEDRYRVRMGNPGTSSLASPSVDLPSPFVQLFASVGFRNDHGIPDRASFAVQYHPDTGKSPRASGLEDGETRLSGYTVGISPTGAKAEPILVRRKGRAWQIGRLDGVETPSVEGGPYDTSALDPWLGLLRPFAR